MSTFFVLPSTGIFPVTFTLDLNDFEFLIATSPSTGSSLYYCHKLPDVFELLLNSIKLYISITTSSSFALSI